MEIIEAAQAILDLMNGLMELFSNGVNIYHFLFKLTDRKDTDKKDDKDQPPK